MKPLSVMCGRSKSRAALLAASKKISIVPVGPLRCFAIINSSLLRTSAKRAMRLIFRTWIGTSPL